MADQTASGESNVLPVTATARFIGSDAAVDGIFTGDGIARYLGTRIRNTTAGTQAVTAATLTKITGTDLAIPTSGAIVAGTTFQWQILITKTAAGTAARTFHVRLGTLGTTADTAIATFTSPLGTAAADAAYVEIIAICTSIAGAVATFECSFTLSHNLATTGFATTGNQILSPPTSTATRAIVASLIASVSVQSGAAEAITVRQVFAQAFNV